MKRKNKTNKGAELRIIFNALIAVLFTASLYGNGTAPTCAQIVTNPDNYTNSGLINWALGLLSGEDCYNNCAAEYAAQINSITETTGLHLNLLTSQLAAGLLTADQYKAARRALLVSNAQAITNGCMLYQGCINDCPEPEPEKRDLFTPEERLKIAEFYLFLMAADLWCESSADCLPKPGISDYINKNLRFLSHDELDLVFQIYAAGIE